MAAPHDHVVCTPDGHASIDARHVFHSTLKKILVLAGATLSDDGKTAIGSHFVLNVNSRAEAKAFSDGDPFTQKGVFASVTITRMRRGQWNPDAAADA